MKILYIPAQLRPALEAPGVEPKDLHSIDALVGILSPEDVAFYCYVNLNLNHVMPEEIWASLPQSFVVDKDASGKNVEDPRVKEVLRILNEYVLNGSAPAVVADNSVLISDVMDENTIRFTHDPRPSGEPASPEQLSREVRGMFDRLIQQLYATMSFDKLAALPLFAGYLKASQVALKETVAA